MHTLWVNSELVYREIATHKLIITQKKQKSMKSLDCFYFIFSKSKHRVHIWEVGLWKGNIEKIAGLEDFMKERIMRFMYGRYGVDKLCRTLVTAALVLLVVSTFVRSNLLYFLSLGVLVYSYYRAFSKNVQARYREAVAYERFKGRIKGMPQKVRERKMYKIFRCPGCGQKVRIPRRKGNVEITCPKCKEVFRGRT